MNRRDVIKGMVLGPVSVWASGVHAHSIGVRSIHPYWGKPYLSVIVPKQTVEGCPTWTKMVSKRSVMISQYSPEEYEFVYLKRQDLRSSQNRYTGLPNSISFKATSILDLQTGRVIKHRDIKNTGTGAVINWWEYA